MSNELAKKEEGAVPTPINAAAQAMADMGIGADDLVVPRLMLMQNTSEAVGDSKAKLGDILNSQTGEVLGGTEKSVEVVPLQMFKTWRVNDMSGKKPKFLRYEEVTPSNEKLPWEDNENGMPIRRDLCYNFFCLLQSEVASGEAFPVVITFKRTGTQAGKKLATMMFKRAALGHQAYTQTVKITVRKDKFESNTYAIFDVEKGDAASTEAQAEARKWLPLLKSMRAKIDEDRDESAVPPSGPAKAPTVVGGEGEQGDLPF